MRRFLLLILILPFLGLSQQKDAVLWVGASGDLGITKKISLEFESQTRLISNMSQFQQQYGELSLGYRLAKGLKSSITYRYARRYNGDYYSNRNRFCLNIRYRYKFDFGLRLASRLRYQHSFDRLSAVNDLLPNRKNLIRWSFKLDYKIKGVKRFLPFIGTELYYAVQPTNQYGPIDTYRFKAGLDIDLPKRHGLKLFYLFENENRSEIQQNHIYCFQYTYAFKPLYKLKKKKKDEN